MYEYFLSQFALSEGKQKFALLNGEDKDTRAVFGDYVSIYDIQDAVEDGATVPIYYESRLAKLDMNQAEIEQLSDQVEEVIEDEEDVSAREKTKSQWAALEKLVGAQARIQEVAADLVKHFAKRAPPPSTARA